MNVHPVEFIKFPLFCLVCWGLKVYVDGVVLIPNISLQHGLSYVSWAGEQGGGLLRDVQLMSNLSLSVQSCGYMKKIAVI